MFRLLRAFVAHAFFNCGLRFAYPRLMYSRPFMAVRPSVLPEPSFRSSRTGLPCFPNRPSGFSEPAFRVFRTELPDFPNRPSGFSENQRYIFNSILSLIAENPGGLPRKPPRCRIAGNAGRRLQPVGFPLVSPSPVFPSPILMFRLLRAFVAHAFFNCGLRFANPRLFMFRPFRAIWQTRSCLSVF
jgi:hypothetical protein